MTPTPWSPARAGECLTCQAGLCAEHAVEFSAVLDRIIRRYPPDATPATQRLRAAMLDEEMPRGLTADEAAAYEEVLERLFVGDAPAPPQPEPAGVRERLGRTSRYVPECETCRSGAVRCPEHGFVRYDATPAPAAPGEMSDAVVAALVGMITPRRGEDADDRYSRERAVRELLDGIAALRASRDEERRNLERAVGEGVVALRERDEAQEELDDTGNRVWDEVLAAVRNAWGEDRPYNGSPCELIAKIIDERDEAREQREDLANEILAGRSDLAAAEAEVVRLNGAMDGLREDARRIRETYDDDPSLDATDGAHPAWWRGNDAGVAGAVRIVNEALGGPLPLAGWVGGADLERVRQRVAALRASVARLVETGDEAGPLMSRLLNARYHDSWAGRNAATAEWLAKWAAAKEQKP